MNKNTGEIGYNQALQFLSQSLFDKSFEEIKETIFNYSKESHFVGILHYGSEAILTHNGNFISQLNIGTPDEISLNLLTSIGKDLAQQVNTNFKNIHLPEILNKDWEINDVINLADRFGCFKYKKDIISCLEEASIVTFNGQTVYTIDGDWIEQLIGEIEEGYDPMQHTIWCAEYINDEYVKFEHYLSLSEILTAKPVNDDFSKWLITDDSGEIHTIQFLF